MGVDVSKPQPLLIDHTVAILVPVGGLGALEPHRLETGKQFLNI